MNRNEGNELYLKAQKLALRDYREKMLAGQSPFLPVPVSYTHLRAHET